MHPITSLRVFCLLLGSVGALMTGLYYDDSCYQPFLRRSTWLALTGLFGIIGFLVFLAREYSLIEWLQDHGYRHFTSSLSKKVFIFVGIFWLTWTIIGAFIFWGPYTSTGCTENTPLKQAGFIYVGLLAGAFVWLYLWRFARYYLSQQSDEHYNQNEGNRRLVSNPDPSPRPSSSGYPYSHASTSSYPYKQASPPAYPYGQAQPSSYPASQHYASYPYPSNQYQPQPQPQPQPQYQAHQTYSSPMPMYYTAPPPTSPEYKPGTYVILAGTDDSQRPGSAPPASVSSPYS